jgi:hypothetical protein
MACKASPLVQHRTNTMPPSCGCLASTKKFMASPACDANTVTSERLHHTSTPGSGTGCTDGISQNVLSCDARPMADLMETKPALRSLRIVGPRVSARTSAARLIGSATRLSILTTVVRCQLPPRAVGIPLRFNSPASSRWETKPAAMSCRMVEAKAAARESAARLLPEGLCFPRLRGAVSPWVNSIGPSWPVVDARC